MSYKINGTDAITDNRQGNFAVVNPGVYSSPPTPTATGDVYYNSSSKKLFAWNGSAWVDVSGTATTSGAATVVTTGATVTTESDTNGYTWNRATFLSSGTIEVKALSTSADQNIVQYFIVGGGGG